MTKPLWQFDTDMLIHLRDVDSSVSSGAASLKQKRSPVAIASFSRVEFKGNYIQDLLLLHNKIEDSSCWEDAAARVMNTGGRRSGLMLRSLLKFVGLTNIAASPWPETQGVLLTHIDAQLLAAWDAIAGMPLHDRTECSRAREPVVARQGRYDATIPRCTDTNTNCAIVRFLAEHAPELRNLANALAALPPSSQTDELNRIASVAMAVGSGEVFDWHGSKCRSIGDLLIALEAMAGSGLVTSNAREHVHLASSLCYSLDIFPLATIRQK